jgi:hypothetical protein
MENKDAGKERTDLIDGAEDVAHVDQPSGGKAEPSPEMLTKEQADKLANEKHSKLDKRIAELEKSTLRASKQVELADKRAKDAENALLEAGRRAEEAERKSLGNTPDALSLFEARIALKQAEAKLQQQRDSFAAEKAIHDEEISEAKTYKLQKMAEEIADETGVDASLLTSMTDGSREKMEKLAKVLPKKTAEDKLNLPKPPDSGKTSGRYGNLTTDQLNKLAENDPDGYARYVEERNKKK